MDWSERRLHLAGPLGAHLAQSFLERKFVIRTKETRALQVTAAGSEAIRAYFGVTLLV